jgi:hypothetical protein
VLFDSAVLSEPVGWDGDSQNGTPGTFGAVYSPKSSVVKNREVSGSSHSGGQRVAFGAYSHPDPCPDVPAVTGSENDPVSEACDSTESAGAAHGFGSAGTWGTAPSESANSTGDAHGFGSAGTSTVCSLDTGSPRLTKSGDAHGFGSCGISGTGSPRTDPAVTW